MTTRGELDQTALVFYTSGVNDVTLTKTANSHATWSSSSGTVLLSGVTDPVNPQDTATKNYVDTHGGGGAVSSVSGTTNQIDVSPTTGACVVSIDPAYPGQTSIITLGTISTGTWHGTLIGSTYGGTGVNNGSSTVTIGGNLAFSGAFGFTGTLTGTTAVTFPTSGTLMNNALTTNHIYIGNGGVATDTAMSGDATIVSGGALTLATVNASSGSTTISSITTNAKGLVTSNTTGNLTGDVTSVGLTTTYNNVVPLTKGGTNASLTASNGGIFYSTATAGAILAGTATAGQMLQSGISSAPSWSTSTWPATTVVNQLLYSTATNTIGGSSNLTFNGTTLTAPQISASQLTSTVATGTAPLIVTSTTQVANLNAATAGSAINVGITDDTTTNATMYPTWVTANTGNLPEKVSSTKLTFNPSTGTLNVDNIGNIGTTDTLWPSTNTVNIGSSNTTGSLITNIASSLSSNIQTSSMTGWTASTILSSGTFTTICYSTVGLYVAVASNGTTATQIYASSNGSTWTAATSPSVQLWSSVCWAPDINQFVAVSNGVSGTGSTAIMYSSTGTGTWLAATAPSSQQWSCVTRSKNVSSNLNNVFVAVSVGLSGISGASGSTAIMYSTSNVTTWIAAVAPVSLHWTSICWSEQLQLFVAVSTGLSSSNSTTVMYSPNISTNSWTAAWNSSTCIAGKWTSICWSDSLNLFVAVDSSGSTSCVMTSSNGLTWTAQTGIAASGGWKSVCWSSKYSMFVAVGGSSSNGSIMYSSNGITWTSATPSSTIAWYAICFGSNIFVAVANANTTGNSMYSTIPSGYNSIVNLGTLTTSTTTIIGSAISIGNTSSTVSIPGTEYVGTVNTKNLSVSNNSYFGNGLSTWYQGQKLVGTGATGYAEQGFSVSQINNYAAVGGKGNNNNIGAVWIYQYISGYWTQMTILTPSDNIGASYFGYSVSLINVSGTLILAVGGINDNANIGAVWIYEYNGSWSEITKIIPPSTGGNAYTGTPKFGYSVSLVNTGTTYTVVIGGNNNSSNIGAVWIYQSTGGPTSWSIVTRITPSSPAGTPFFGNSVSMVVTGTTYTAAIGGYQDNSLIGAAWIYQNTTSGTGTWSSIIKIIPPSTGPNAYISTPFFGASVSLVNTGTIYTVAIGGYVDNSSIGAVWIYQSPSGGGSGTWAIVTKIAPTDGLGPNPFFGVSVSLYNSGSTYTAAIGGWGDNTQIGAAWIYQNTTSGTGGWTEIIKMIPNNTINTSNFGQSISLYGNLLLVGGEIDNSSIGAAWIYNYSSVIVTIGSGNLTASGTLTGSTLTDGEGTFITGGTVIANTLVSNNIQAGVINLSNTTASTSSTTGALLSAGGIGISNTTDATSFTNGGSFTTAGGVAIAKSLIVGGTVTAGILNVLGNATISGSISANAVVPISTYLTVGNVIVAPANVALSGYNTGPWGSLNNIGLQIGWNNTGGDGETDYLNNAQGGGGGHFWYYTNNSITTPSLIMSLYGTGNLNVGGIVSCGPNQGFSQSGLGLPKTISCVSGTAYNVCSFTNNCCGTIYAQSTTAGHNAYCVAVVNWFANVSPSSISYLQQTSCTISWTGNVTFTVTQSSGATVNMYLNFVPFGASI